MQYLKGFNQSLLEEVLELTKKERARADEVC